MFEKLKNLLENHYSTKLYIHLLAEETGINQRTLRRKLNGESLFTIEEIMHLANILKVAPEYILDDTPETNKYNMEMLLHDFSLSPKKYQYTLQKIIDLFQQAGKSNYSSLYITCNTLPDIIYPEFDCLQRFNLQKWLYFNQGVKTDLTSLGSDIDADIVQQQYIDAIHSIRRSVYIININVIHNFLKYVKYFFDIRLLNKSDVEQLMAGIKKLLQRVESIAHHGYVPENGKEVELFYTDIPLSDEINLIESDNINLAMFYVHTNNIVVNRTAEVVKIMKNWIYSWMRNSKAMGLGGSKNLDFFLAKQMTAIRNFEKEMGFN